MGNTPVNGPEAVVDIIFYKTIYFFLNYREKMRQGAMKISSC
ncbi:MAG: hypothetical protein RBR67_20415 [Desulfobacterium sp.]|nr:hypothetical protein [Desulfobacterium sp.]